MALAPGTRPGPYEIAAQIGVDGTREVYRATNTNLGRSVAIKVLPDSAASGPERPVRFGREASALVAALLTVTVIAACAAPFAPATWRELEARLPGLSAIERDVALARLIDDRGGTPLVEGDSGLVFLARDDSGSPPRIVGDFNAWASTPAGFDDAIGVMRPVEGTSWWVLEATADPDARIEYMVVRADTVRPDPLNPRSVLAATGPQSEVRMPAWVPQPELDDATPVQAGRVAEWTIDSVELGGTRHGWTYLPVGYDDGEARYPTVYVLDGGNYVGPMEVPLVLDRLIAAARIPAAVVVFVPPEDRYQEYVNDEAWLTFVAMEVVPGVDAAYRTRPAPDARVILGSSLGAVGATRLALSYPDVFGLVAAIAPPAEAATYVSRLLSSGSDARSWFVLGGRYDPLRPDAERLTAELWPLGEPVTAIEVPEGHSRETFRGHLDDALGSLLGADGSAAQ